MHKMRPTLVAIMVVLFTLTTIGTAPMAFAQAEKPSVTKRIGIWTRAQLEKAKKRWAESEARFDDCAAQLKEKQKSKRLSPHKQADFLEACMARKP